MSSREQDLQKAASLQYAQKTLSLMADHLEDLGYEHFSSHIDSITKEISLDIQQLTKCGPLVQRILTPGSVQNRVGPAIQSGLFDGDV